MLNPLLWVRVQFPLVPFYFDVILHYEIIVTNLDNYHIMPIVIYRYGTWYLFG